jgi:hypothetical protein
MIKPKFIAGFLFAAMFIAGIFFINTKIPYDKPASTVSYSAETNAYVPPGASSVEKFDAGNMAVATVGMAGFTKIASSPGSQNLMSSFLLKGG